MAQLNENCQGRGQKDYICLPNMLLATTYGINKSNSKRIYVGLEYSGGYYRACVKLSGNSNSRWVSFDSRTWTLLKNHFDLINAYFQDAYRYQTEYGKPSKVYLEGHDLLFTTSYNSKTILIEERTILKTPVLPDHLDEIDENGESCSKKKKTSCASPNTCIQKITFDGLKLLVPCIDEQLLQLEEVYVGKVNRIIDYIFEYLKKEVKRDGGEDPKETIMKNYPAFQQYYTLINNNVNAFVKEKMVNDSDLNKHTLNIVLLEISANTLPFIYNDLYAFLFDP